MRDTTHLTNAHDVDVVLGILRMGHERLHEERPQNTGNMLNLLGLAGALGNPSPGLGPGLIQGQEAALASPLDQLVGLRDELGTGMKKPRIGDFGLVQDILDVGILGKLEGG